MTSNEVNESYYVPKKILKEYESYGLYGALQMAMEQYQYKEQDLERLSMIMVLHDIGFCSDEVQTYMKLWLKKGMTNKERMQMLNERRSKTLDEIHLRERQLERMDYLRNEIRCGEQIF